MIDKTKVIPLILTTIKSTDVSNYGNLFPGLNTMQLDRINRIANDMKKIYSEFDYVKSPDFQASVKDKSEAYISFVKQSFGQAHEDRLFEALRNIENNDTIFELIQEQHKHLIENIRKNISEL